MIALRRLPPCLVLCVGFQCRFRGADLLQAVLLGLHPIRQLVPALVDAIRRVFVRVAGGGLSQSTSNLRGKRRFGGLHSAITHRLVLGGVGADLGPIQCHVSQSHQPRLLA